MDGNKRWSIKNNLSQVNGYSRGLDKLKEVVNYCIKKKIQYLTVYTLSTENIGRDNVSIIYDIIVKNYQKLLKEKNFVNFVKMNIIGEKKDLPNQILDIFNNIKNYTNNNEKLILNLAFNYGSDKELLSIVKKIQEKKETFIEQENKDLLKKYMYLGDIPNPDLLIRTGGQKRLSNFLLLYLNYTELFFINTLWPEFTIEELDTIINEFMKTDRKYGL